VILNHCHAGPTAYFKRLSGGKGKEDGSKKKLLAYLKALGYERAVVFAPFKAYFKEDPNAWVLKEFGGDPRFVPWATLNERGLEAASMLSRLGPGQIKGVKWHPPITKIGLDDRELRQFFSLAEYWRLPIVIHTGPHGWDPERYSPKLVTSIARRHPKLPLIIEHLGGQKLASETWRVMELRPNVFGGLTSCLLEEATWHVPAKEIASKIREFGASRFIFGADFPYNSASYNLRSIQVLKSMDLPPSDLELILSGNLEGLLRRVDSGISPPVAPV
jgi:predicted TIM-barrel fold metal-dependent hydrolase